MFRPAPTAISLSKRDVDEHLDHIEEQRQSHGNSHPLPKFESPWPPRPTIRAFSTEAVEEYEEEYEELLEDESSFIPVPQAGRDVFARGVPDSDTDNQNEMLDAIDEIKSDTLFETSENYRELLRQASYLHIGETDSSSHLEDPVPLPRQHHAEPSSSSPSEHSFHYEGFITSPAHSSSISKF